MVTLKNESGLKVKCPTGFSFTCLLFGFFVPLLRGWYSMVVVYVLSVLVTGGIAWLVFPFILNKQYIKHLLNNGFKAFDVKSDYP